MKKIFLKIRKYLFLGNLLLSLFVLGLFLIIFSTFLGKTYPQPKFGGKFTEGFYESVTTLNPFLASKESERTIVNIIYPPLIEFQENKIISKYLKSYFKSPDSLVYRIELKDDLKWSDGTRITTDDLKFSFEAFKNYSPLKNRDFFKNVELEILDKTKAEFLLKENDNYFFYHLNYLNVLPVKAFSQYPLKEVPESVFKIGSGPFILDSISQHDVIDIIKLKRNPYYKPKPYLDELDFYVYPSSKRAFDGLLLKEIDSLGGLNYFKLPANIYYHYEIKKIILPRIIGIFFNSQKVKKEEVEFLEKRIDRAEIIKKIFQGYAEESRGIYSPTLRRIFNLSQISPSYEKQAETDLSHLEIVSPSLYFYPDIARFLKEKFKFKIVLVSEEEIKTLIENKNFTALL